MNVKLFSSPEDSHDRKAVCETSILYAKSKKKIKIGYGSLSESFLLGGRGAVDQGLIMITYRYIYNRGCSTIHIIYSSILLD